jgi:hypothetical protein
MVDPVGRKLSKPYQNAHLIRICKGYATKKKFCPSILPVITVEMLTSCPPMVRRLRRSHVWIPF